MSNRKKSIKALVMQTHVWYDDDSLATFTTPLMQSDAFAPLVLVPLVGDVGRWFVAMAGAGFLHPEGANVVGMPFNVILSNSFQDNPTDSIIACQDYPGVELRMNIPLIGGQTEIPPSAWHADDGEEEEEDI